MSFEYEHSTIAFQLNALCKRVFSAMGRAFPLPAYKEAICIELEQMGIDFECERRVEYRYGEHLVDNGSHLVDFYFPQEQAILCVQQTVLEPQVVDIQVLKNKGVSLGVRVACLVNFGLPSILQRPNVDWYNLIFPLTTTQSTVEANATTTQSTVEANATTTPTPTTPTTPTTPPPSASHDHSESEDAP